MLWEVINYAVFKTIGLTCNVYENNLHISVTSLERKASNLNQNSNKEIIKALHYWPFVLTDNQWIPSTKD